MRCLDVSTASAGSLGWGPRSFATSGGWTATPTSSTLRRGGTTSRYWLTRDARRVVAIDIYGEGDFANREAGATMPSDPASLAPYPYAQDRLEVRSMDAWSLQFEDASFDACDLVLVDRALRLPSDIARAAREIGRVLRPGGHAFLVTEVYLDRHVTETAPVQAARASSRGAAGVARHATPADGRRVHAPRDPPARGPALRAAT